MSKKSKIICQIIHFYMPNQQITRQIKPNYMTNVKKVTMSFSRYFKDDDEVVQLSLSAHIFTRGNIRQTTGCACAIYINDDPNYFITESVWSTKKPVFTTKMQIIPKLSTPQILRVMLLEMTPTIKPIEEYTKFGEAKIPLGRVLVSNGVAVTLSGAAAEVTIQVSQESAGRGVLSMIVAFYNMPKDHWLMKNYPELHICKQENENRWASVRCTEVIKRQDAGQWDPISIPCRSICNNDYTKKIRFKVVDHPDEGNIVPIGYADASVQEVSQFRNKILTLTPYNPRVARCGNLIVRAATLIERLTFYGQLCKGLRFNFACAIDFASTNRPARDSKSLHYTTFGQDNAYQATMNAIGGAIEPYSDGHPFRAWGFAAKYNRVMSQSFPLTLEGSEELAGLKALQNAYWNIFESIVFDKPVLIVPSLQMAINRVKGSRNPGNYLVFLILLANIPDDLEDFIDLLYQSQMEPISVIIVGIGDTDFTLLEQSFETGKLVNSAGKSFDRDVAVFLRFNNFGMNGLTMLTSSALFSIPDQAMHWFEVNIELNST